MRCKRSEYDRYFGECMCRKYGMPTRICCDTCREPEYETDPAKL